MTKYLCKASVPTVNVGDQGVEAKGDVTRGDAEESPVEEYSHERRVDVMKIEEKSARVKLRRVDR